MRSRAAAAGFTLVETLVALVIVAFGMGALMSTLTSAADSVTYLRDKTFAEWIALNRVSELRLRLGSIAIGKSTGQVDFANAQWQWTATIQDTGLADLTRIDVEVGRAVTGNGNGKVDVLATASGFMGKAVQRSNGETPDWSGEFYKAEVARERTQTGATPGTVPGTVPATGTGTVVDQLRSRE